LRSTKIKLLNIGLKRRRECPALCGVFKNENKVFHIDTFFVGV
tara:strand:- start:4606 stop:4734 length:129 start_codon:yes stop_codon:yes gene_type:complete